MSTASTGMNGHPHEETEAQVLPPPHWVEGHPSLSEITDDIARPMEARPGKGWWICFGVAFAALLNLGGMVTYLIAKGIGVWGLNNSVGSAMVCICRRSRWPAATAVSTETALRLGCGS